MTDLTNVFSPSECPLLTCLADGLHSHLVCPECGAVRYGNPFYCKTCRVHYEKEDKDMGVRALTAGQMKEASGHDRQLRRDQKEHPVF